MQHRRAGRGVFAAIAVGLIAAACSNPVSPGDHRFAAGVVVRDAAGAELVRAQGTTVTGGLTVAAGQQTGPLTVWFLNSSGEEMAPPSGYWLKVESVNPAVASWTQATAGEFGGRLVGGIAGQTTLRFLNMHGAVGSGHDDGLQDVTVTVTAAP
jgi:hypothetical protein